MNNNQIQLHLANIYGIDARFVERINIGVANENYVVRTEDASYLFKVYKRKSPENVMHEHAIITYLTARRFSSPKLVATKQQTSYALYDGHPSACFEYIEGTPLGVVSRDDLEAIGAQLGKLHLLLQEQKFADTHERWEPKDMMRILTTECEVIHKNGFSNERALVLASLKSLEYPSDLPYGMTHQDVKPDNIIRKPNGELAFIDFGNAYNGTLLYDLLTPIIWTCIEKGSINSERMMRVISGYEKRRSLDDSERDHLYDALQFRLLREVVIWMWLYSGIAAVAKVKHFLTAYVNLRKQKELL